MKRIWLILMTSGVLACPGIASAQTETILVPYGADGWRYREVHNGSGIGFEAGPEDLTWNFKSGIAPFGGGSDLAPGACPLQAGVQTPWLTDTDMLLRRTVTIPRGTTNVKVKVVIDNDAKVYWNDQDVGGGGLRGGCPRRDNPVEVPVTVSPEGGDYLLAIRAIDVGVESFVDVQVTGVLADQIGPDLLVQSAECIRNPDNTLKMRVTIANMGNRPAGPFNIDTLLNQHSAKSNHEPYYLTSGWYSRRSAGIAAHGTATYELEYAETGLADDQDPTSNEKFLYYTDSVTINIDKGMVKEVVDETYTDNNSDTRSLSCPS
jgi:hypothetical protein